jgi:hypothetical protein
MGYKFVERALTYTDLMKPNSWWLFLRGIKGRSGIIEKHLCTSSVRQAARPHDGEQRVEQSPLADCSIGRVKEACVRKV